MKLARNFVSAVALTASIVLSTGSSPARANTPAPVFGTGQNLAPSDRDSRWQVIAGPAGFVPPDSQTYPYSSYVTSVFTPLIQNGVTYRWISITSDELANSTAGNRNWILRQAFNVSTAGTYSFDFIGGADNGIDVFVNGTIDSSNVDLPTISGGTLLAPAVINIFPDANQLFGGTATLNAGDNYLYAVLNDFGGPTSFLIGNVNVDPANSSTDVPAPLPLFGVAAAFGASRRLRRRIRLARPAATAGIVHSTPESV
jgi:hypothetical protein